MSSYNDADDASAGSQDSDVTGMISQIIDLEAYVLESPNLRDQDSKEILKRLSQAKLRLLQEQSNPGSSGGAGAAVLADIGEYLPMNLNKPAGARSSSRSVPRVSRDRSRSGSRPPSRNNSHHDDDYEGIEVDNMSLGSRGGRSVGSRRSAGSRRRARSRSGSRAGRDFNDSFRGDDDERSYHSRRSSYRGRDDDDERSYHSRRSSYRGRDDDERSYHSRRSLSRRDDDDDRSYHSRRSLSRRDRDDYDDYDDDRSYRSYGSRSYGSRGRRRPSSRGRRSRSNSRSVSRRDYDDDFDEDDYDRGEVARRRSTSRGGRSRSGSRSRGRMPDDYDDDDSGEIPSRTSIPQAINTVGRMDDDMMSELRSTYTPAPTVWRPSSERDLGVIQSSGQSVFSESRRSRKDQAIEDKSFENAGYQPDLIIEERSGPLPWTSGAWEILSYLLTFPIPDFCIRKEGHGPKKAWREKVAIFLLFLMISCGFVVGISLLPIFLCEESEEHFDELQVGAKGWTSVHGRIYDLEEFQNLHPGGFQPLQNYYGEDASDVFPRLPPTELPEICLSKKLNETVFNATNILGLQNITCRAAPPVDLEFQYGDLCHYGVVGIEEMEEKMGEFEQGWLVIPGFDLGPGGFADDGSPYIILDNYVYNVSSYIQGLRSADNFKADTDHDNEMAYLNEPLHNLLVNKLNEDASDLFRVVFPNEKHQEAMLSCLDELFYHGQIDDRYTETCVRIAMSQYVLVAIFSFLTAVQVICSLAYIARRPPFVKEDDMQAGVMVMVPCYNESDNELRKTIDSVLANKYPDENKVLCVVADGVITGRGEALSCPETLGAILGFTFSNLDDAFEYTSIGAKTTNFASIYSGRYTSEKYQGKYLKYLVVIKQGGPDEINTPRAGNRGKRDSQLLLFGIINRLQYNRRPTQLDLVFRQALDNLEIPLKDVEYLMAIDADTRVSDTAMRFFVHKMENDKSALACCGETRVDNKAQSFVTMLQVFEYYSAHHLKKAFESVFGCVTCLPGCFTLYRLYTEELQPLLTSDNIFVQYSRNDITSLHERNLYELGEDRMLTTLMLQEFNGMSLCFVPEATCWTIVPHNFQILKSQRRRWINSTIHNMCELLKVETMCGICFFSMKLVVIFDLFATFLLPSGCIYLYYIIIDAIMSTEPLGPLQMIAFAYIGVMMVPFIFRAQWDFFFWFFVFLVGGVPTFYFYLPVYAFWHMDDLSWGKTRQVKAAPTPAEGEGDDAKKDTDTQASPTSDEQTSRNLKSTRTASLSASFSSYNDVESSRALTRPEDNNASAPAISYEVGLSGDDDESFDVDDLKVTQSVSQQGRPPKRRIEDRYGASSSNLPHGGADASTNGGNSTLVSALTESQFEI